MAIYRGEGGKTDVVPADGDQEFAGSIIAEKDIHAHGNISADGDVTIGGDLHWGGTITGDGSGLENVPTPFLQADDCIYLNNQVITNDYTMPVGKNGMSAGEVTVNGELVIPDGSDWHVVGTEDGIITLDTLGIHNHDLINVDETGQVTVQGITSQSPYEGDGSNLTGLPSVSDVESLATQVTTNATNIQANSDSIQANTDAINAIPSAEDVYTKTQTDTLLDNKADKSNTYTKSETYSNVEVDSKLYTKADKVDTYTKDEVDAIAGAGGGGGSGGVSTVANGCIYLNNQTVEDDYTIPVGMNGMSAGAIEFKGTVTVPDGSKYHVVDDAPGSGDSIWTEVGSVATYDGSVGVGTDNPFAPSGKSLEISDDATTRLILNNTAANRMALFTPAFGGLSIADYTDIDDIKQIAQFTADGVETDQDITVNGITVGTGSGTGDQNTVVGKDALSSATTGGYNVALGRNALKENLVGVNNVAVGTNSLANLKGSNNTAIGHSNGQTLTTGSNNTVIGNGAEPSAPDVSNEITLGNVNVDKLRLGNGNQLPTDYETGGFAPRLGDGTNNVLEYYYQHGRFTKIGNLVNVKLLISVKDKGAVTGNLQITNLPFVNSDNQPHLGNHFPIYCFNGMDKDYDGARINNADTIQLLSVKAQTGPFILGTTITGGSQIGINFHYFTT